METDDGRSLRSEVGRMRTMTIKRLYDSSPVCKKIAREVAEEIVKENPNKAFRRMFERIGVIFL